MKSFRNSLIRQWILFNYLGWLLVIIIGPIFYMLVISPRVWLNASLVNILMPIFLSFPLGISVGALQNIVIQQWKLPISSWIVNSLLSSIVATAIAVWLFHIEIFGNDITAIFLVPSLAGLVIATFQTVSLRKLVSRPLLWAIAYISGLFISIIAVLAISIVAFVSADFIIKTLYSLKLWDVVFYRDIVLMIFNLLFTFPISLAIVIGLSTGNILRRNLANPKTGYR